MTDPQAAPHGDDFDLDDLRERLRAVYQLGLAVGQIMADATARIADEDGQETP